MNGNNPNMNLNNSNNNQFNNGEPELPENIIRPNESIQNLNLQLLPLDQIQENEYYYVVDTFQNPNIELIVKVVENSENTPYVSVHSFFTRRVGDIWLDEFQGFPFLKEHIEMEFILFYPVERNLNGGKRKRILARKSKKSKKSGKKSAKKLSHKKRKSHKSKK